MSILSTRLTKLRVAIGAGAIALGLAVSSAATPAQADDGWHNGFRNRVEREHARERAREAWRRHQWLEHHRFAQIPPRHFVRPPPPRHAPPPPWFYR